MEAKGKYKEELKQYATGTQPKHLAEYKEFQELIEGLDVVRRVLPPDHRSINRNLYQLHHLLKKAVQETDKDRPKEAQAYRLPDNICRKIVLSGWGYDATRMENGLKELRYATESGSRQEMVRFKEKDLDLYSQVERSFESILQRTIDQISKDAIAGLDKTSYMTLTSDWQRKVKLLMQGNKPLDSEEGKFQYTTPSKG